MISDDTLFKIKLVDLEKGLNPKLYFREAFIKVYTNFWLYFSKCLVYVIVQQIEMKVGGKEEEAGNVSNKDPPCFVHPDFLIDAAQDR